MSQDVFSKLSEISESQARGEIHQVNSQKLLEKHAELLEKHNETLLRLTITVERHEERSTKLEVRQDYLEKGLQVLKDHVTRLQGAGHLLKMIGVGAGALSVAGSFFWGVYHLMQRLGL